MAAAKVDVNLRKEKSCRKLSSLPVLTFIP